LKQLQTRGGKERGDRAAPPDRGKEEGGKAARLQRFA